MNHHHSPQLRFGRRPRSRDRSRAGLAVVLVLGLLSIALALSYATLRSQATIQQIQDNNDRRQQARLTANAGLGLALARMHEANWGGVGSTLTGTLSSTESYSVAFVGGDPRLTSTSPDYGRWARRVTVTATGSSSDPAYPTVVVTHRARAIVELVPRSLASEISGWSSTLPFTLYQFGTQSCELQLPCRIEGACRLQGTVSLASSAPNTTASRQRYLADLNLMRTNGQPDYRTVTGPISLPFSATGQTTRDLFTSQLGVTLSDITQQSSQSISFSLAAGTYRLYPGSPTFNMQTVGSSLEEVTLSPDPVTNPLGIHYRNGSVTIADDVTIRGTLLCTGTVTVEGEDVQFEPADLANVSGQSDPVRLPVVIANTFRLNTEATGQARGNVVCWSEFRAVAGCNCLDFTIQGRVLTNRFRFEAREEYTARWWSLLLTLFQADAGGHAYFPTYVAAHGALLTPDLVIRPDASNRRDHYYNPSDPFYAVAAGDGGLYWDILELTDLPAGTNVP